MWEKFLTKLPIYLELLVLITFCFMSPSVKIAVSSASKKVLVQFKAKSISFIYILKNDYSKMESWGTPVLIIYIVDFLTPIW